MKQFHQNMWKEVEDLPVTITRYGKPSFVVDVVPGGMEVKKTEFVPSEPREKISGTCSWSKSIGGNTFYCKEKPIALRDGKGWCKDHL